MGVAETHLIGANEAALPGYSWLGHNRTALHHRARCGSGGVGVFIRDQIGEEYRTEILNDSVEGILWIKFTARHTAHVFTIDVCYLPPGNSSRHVDSQCFYEDLLSHVYMYQKLGPFIIMDDFNSRCVDAQDYIEGVDSIGDRDIVDRTVNDHSEQSIQFLISAICCMLNGRKSLVNDYTCISGKGLSVVDYVVVPHEHLDWYSDFTVHRSRALFNDAGCVSNIDPSRVISDHSCLSWLMLLPTMQIGSSSTHGDNQPGTIFTKFDLSAIPVGFMDNDSCHSAVHCVRVFL